MDIKKIELCLAPKNSAEVSGNILDALKKGSNNNLKRPKAFVMPKCLHSVPSFLDAAIF